VTLTMHGQWTLPWPVFQRFLDAIHAAGDIVERLAVAPTNLGPHTHASHAGRAEG
jgi:hypothetical protein